MGNTETIEAYYSFYEYIKHWNSIGIVTIYSAGNEGQGCNTMSSEASYDISFSVGAVDANVVLAKFSSIGPGISTKPLTEDSISVGVCSFVRCGNENRTCALIKPTVVAPGVNIRSSWITNDTSYHFGSVTSAAAPHVAGVVALMMCANRNIIWNYKKANKILTSTTDTSRIDLMSERQNKNNSLHIQTNLMCNVMLHDICNTYPNNMYGYGLVNACRAVGASKRLLW